MAEQTYGDSLINAQGLSEVENDLNLFNEYNDLLSSGYSQQVALDMLKRGQADPSLSLGKMHTQAQKFGTDKRNKMDLDFNEYFTHIQSGGDSLSSQGFVDKWSDQIEDLPTAERAKYVTHAAKLRSEELKHINASINKQDADAARMTEALNNLEGIMGPGGYDTKMLINVFFPMEELVNEALQTARGGLEQSYEHDVELSKVRHEEAQGPITKTFGPQHQLRERKPAAPDLDNVPVLIEFNELQEINLNYLEDMEVLGTDPSALGNREEFKGKLRGNKKEFLNGLKKISKLLPIPRKKKTDWSPSAPGSDLPSLPLLHESQESLEEAQNRWYVDMAQQYEQALNTLDLKFKENAKIYQRGNVPEYDAYERYIVPTAE